MSNKTQHLAAGSDTLLSLSSIVGKPIVDVHGFVSREFGSPVFQVSDIVFADGTSESIGADDGIPFIDTENHDQLGDDALDELDPEDLDDDEDVDDEADEDDNS